MYCYLCKAYISLFTLRHFCDDCDNLRRLYLINEKNNFLCRVKKEFIKDQALQNKIVPQKITPK